MDPLVIFTPSGKRGRFPVGTPVLDAARALGVDLDSVCGGRGKCSKCQVAPAFGQFPKHGVEVADGAVSPMNTVEARYDAIRGLADGRRLGCQAQILGDLVVDVPPESQVHRQVVRKAASQRPIAMDPATRLVMVEVAQPDMHEPSGDAERLQAALADQWGIDGVRVPLSVLTRLQKVLRAGDWTVTCVIHQDQDTRLLDVLPGLAETAAYGVAIDLGSTTIAGHLCDLRSGNVVASSGVMNPQIRFGEDLMSRVSYAMMNDSGAADMTAAVREALGTLAEALVTEAGVDQAQVYEAVIVCNPVMHHLALGIDPVELGQAPFALATSGALRLAASEVMAGLNPEAQLYLLPCVAGHVGADAAAVALSEAPDQADGLTLIVDVGTNAELLLGDREGVLACSSPTGPAFEGAQISAGQRAAPGAIERVEIDPVTKDPRFRVIGDDRWSDAPGFDAQVTGICGSGIIEAVAELRLAGIMDATGLIGGPDQVGSPRCEPDGRTFAYRLWDGVTVTQGDIRAIQLAKSALYAGARLLMDARGAEHVDRVVLAGAFGAHISPRHAMVLGMIPDVPLDHVLSAGNAAGHGARMALCSVAARRQIETLVQRIEKIETAVEPRFQEHFVNANAIPHAVDPFPNIGPLPQVSFGATSARKRRRR